MKPIGFVGVNDETRSNETMVYNNKDERKWSRGEQLFGEVYSKYIS